MEAVQVLEERRVQLTPIIRTPPPPPNVVRRLASRQSPLLRNVELYWPLHCESEDVVLRKKPVQQHDEDENSDDENRVFYPRSIFLFESRIPAYPTGSPVPDGSIGDLPEIILSPHIVREIQESETKMYLRGIRHALRIRRSAPSVPVWYVTGILFFLSAFLKSQTYSNF